MRTNRRGRTFMIPVCRDRGGAQGLRSDDTLAGRGRTLSVCRLEARSGGSGDARLESSLFGGADCARHSASFFFQSADGEARASIPVVEIHLDE